MTFEKNKDIKTWNAASACYFTIRGREKKKKKERQFTRSKHIKASKERYLLGQDKNSQFSG